MSLRGRWVLSQEPWIYQVTEQLRASRACSLGHPEPQSQPVMLLASLVVFGCPPVCNIVCILQNHHSTGTIHTVSCKSSTWSAGEPSSPPLASRPILSVVVDVDGSSP